MRMMRIVTIMLLCIVSLCSTAQVCTDKLNNTTDPSNPQHHLGNDPTTNIYVNLRADDPSLPKLDWMVDQYQWWHEGSNVDPDFFCNVRNPFDALNHDINVDRLYNSNPLLRDNRPENGWELMLFNFGIRIDDGTVDNVSHPYIVLYNKWRGVLRVFYYLREPNFNEDYDLVSLRLSFEDGTEDKQSANLNHFEEVAKPIDLFVKDQNQQTSNQLDNGITNVNDCTGMWMYADFVMAYDPCVCEYTYDRLQIDVMATNIASISLTGDLTTNEATKTAPNNGQANTGSGHKAAYKTVISSGIKAGKSAKTFYKSGGDWVSFAAGIAGKIPPEKDVEITKYVKLAKGVPYLGAAIGLVDFFLFQEDKDDKPKAQAVSFNATVNITGTIEDNASPGAVLFHVPGSDFYNISNLKEDQVPLYDEPMGVVSLLKTPKIEYSHIQTRLKYMPNGNTQVLPTHVNSLLPVVTEYKVVDDLELVINPSSELELVDAKASIVLTYNSDQSSIKEFENNLDLSALNSYPVIPDATLTYPVQTQHNHIPSSQNGGFGHHQFWGIRNINPAVNLYDHDDWQKIQRHNFNLEVQEEDKYYKVSYGQSPISCFKGTNFYLISQQMPSSPEELAKMVLRVNINMKHPLTGVYYKFVQSYSIDISQLIYKDNGEIFFDIVVSDVEDDGVTEEDYDLANNGPAISQFNNRMFLLSGFIGNGSNNYWQNSQNLADFRFFENTGITQDVDVWDGIVIGDNVTIASGVTLTAGRYITISPENKYNPEIKMQIGIRDATCLDDPNNFVVTDITALNTFCTSNNPQTYNPVVPKRDLMPDVEESDKPVTYNFNLYPNPTDNLVNVAVEWEENQTYTIAVLDISGREVLTSILVSEEFIGGTTTINTSSLESGIYFVNVRQGAHTMTKRLVITR